MSKILIHKIIESDRLTNEDLIKQKATTCTFLNPVSYITAIKNERLFARFDNILVDGFILVAAIYLLYGVKIRRRSFDMTSLAAQLFNHALSEKKTIYLVGAPQEHIENSVRILLKQYHGMQIVGYRNGYFSSTDAIQEECERILRLNPDYIIIGMGTPLQEHFLLQLKASGYGGIGFTCGGFISQLSLKGIAYYPRWADKYNLRFLYRFYKEKHTRKRYLKAAFLFPLYFVWDKLK